MFENEHDFLLHNQETTEDHISHRVGVGWVFGHFAIHVDESLIHRKPDYRTIVEVTCDSETTGIYYNIYCCKDLHQFDLVLRYCKSCEMIVSDEIDQPHKNNHYRVRYWVNSESLHGNVQRYVGVIGLVNPIVHSISEAAVEDFCSCWDGLGLGNVRRYVGVIGLVNPIVHSISEAAVEVFCSCWDAD